MPLEQRAHDKQQNMTGQAAWGGPCGQGFTHMHGKRRAHTSVIWSLAGDPASGSCTRHESK
jgi:hypothetical protein